MTDLPSALNDPAWNDPAWLHGATAFTTVRTRRGQPLLWAAHIERLRGTCDFLGLPHPDPTPPTLHPHPWGLLRVTVTAHGTLHTHRPLTPGPRPQQGVTVRVTDLQIHPQLGAHKTGNYLPYRLAATQAHPHFEGWLQDARGHVVDGSRTSPLLEIGGGLVVPEEGLPSVTRAAYLTGRPHDTRPVHTQDLSHVTRAWLCGSGTGLVPIRRIDGHTDDLPVHWPAPDDPVLGWPDGV